MNYILDHWKGLRSLKQSFWINFFLVLLIICVIEYFLHLFLKPKLSFFIPASIIYFVIFHVFVFIWQTVGTLRACDRNISQYISSGWTRAAQFTVIISFTAILIWGLTLGQSIQRLKIKQQERITEENTIPTYTLTIENQILAINGLLDQGITREVKNILSENNSTRTIIFNSTGGNIYEARGLAKLILEKKFSTHINETCYSACTTAYIAGVERTINENAKLGFHQYKLDTNKLLHRSVDVKEEQNKDLSFFLQQNIDQEFIAKAFSTPHNQLWFPTHKELIDAGIVQKILLQKISE